MTSRGSKRSRKEQVEAVAPVKKETSEEVPPAKRGRGRPKKPEHLKKKWVSSGRPRGRPRIHPLDTNEPKRPKGRPRLHPIDGENGSTKSKKVTSRGQVKRGRPKKE